ncbi:LOW QUALITY PROTEIN: F-box/LRR-repeat protein At3g58940-like [Salvia hispanica]|uniref:LOW QUALITY PROTEIN: F-box/LRR-repeat protein At3g58940-like n=1 Tax=Salvia hispanica TaxID=49212 RepID=UPI002009BC98|nr:LOW QUALITY PROTEIN: F-box/LRR-repeat protein At3g58940-like [Salvia hispanica]
MDDRISELPDDILQHILSFIDTCEVVRTSILSKRWKHQWRFLLNKEDRITQLPVDRTDDLRRDLLTRGPYHFVSEFLSHRDAAAPLHDFHLSLDTNLWVRKDLALVEECVLYAINQGVQSLRLHVPKDVPLRLPASLLTSTMLRELVIRQKHQDSRVRIPARFSLPNLKTLYLDVDLSFNYDDWMEPFSGLPELEKLSVRVSNDFVLKAPPKLRVLEIFGTSSPIRIEVISAPLLTSFRYEGLEPFECSKMNLPMLEEVDLDIHGIIYETLKWNCVKLLHQLGNATIVSLTLNTLMILELDGGPIEQTPPFPNLKCLKVRKGLYSDHTVHQSVMNYLTIGTLYFGSSLKVEIPRDVAVVQQHPQVYDQL